MFVNPPREMWGAVAPRWFSAFEFPFRSGNMDKALPRKFLFCLDPALSVYVPSLMKITIPNRAVCLDPNSAFVDVDHLRGSCSAFRLPFLPYPIGRVNSVLKIKFGRTIPYNSKPFRLMRAGKKHGLFSGCHVASTYFAVALCMRGTTKNTKSFSI